MARCVGYIYEENDYTVFKKLKDNRKVTKGRVDKLVQSFSEKEIMNPIVVNDKMEIIDGQGRFEAKKRLGTPIRYVIEPNADIEDCRRMNRFNSKWCFDDYVESYAEEGNENYVRLMNLKDEMGVSYSKVLIMSHKRGETTRDAVKAGTLKFSEQNVEKARRVFKAVNDIKDALLITKMPNDTFFNAVKIITDFDGYIHKVMVSNCGAERYRYRQMAKLEDQLKEFSRIYNRGAKKRDRLQFETWLDNKGYNVQDYEKMERNLTGDISTLE